MRHTAAVYPGPILCGSCGGAMRVDEQKRMQIVLFIRCVHPQCEQHDVRLVFPLTLMALQRAD